MGGNGFATPSVFYPIRADVMAFHETITAPKHWGLGSREEMALAWVEA